MVNDHHEWSTINGQKALEHHVTMQCLATWGRPHSCESRNQGHQSSYISRENSTVQVPPWNQGSSSHLQVNGEWLSLVYRNADTSEPSLRRLAADNPISMSHSWSLSSQHALLSVASHLLSLIICSPICISSFLAYWWFLSPVINYVLSGKLS